MGPVVIVLVLLALIPVFLVGTGILMAITGQMFVKNAEKTHEGSELVDTNV